MAKVLGRQSMGGRELAEAVVHSWHRTSATSFRAVGIANLILWSNTFEKYRKVTRPSTTLIVRGKVQREGEVVHVSHVATADAFLPRVRSSFRDFH